MFPGLILVVICSVSVSVDTMLPASLDLNWRHLIYWKIKQSTVAAPGEFSCGNFVFSWIKPEPEQQLSLASQLQFQTRQHSASLQFQ
jgi:hypothetical protein